MSALLLPITVATAFLLALFVAALAPVRRRDGVGPLLALLSVLTGLVGLGALARLGVSLPPLAGDPLVMGLFASLPLLGVRLAAGPARRLDAAALAVPLAVALVAIGAGASGPLGLVAWQGFTVALHVLALGCAVWIGARWRDLARPTRVALAAFGVHWLWSAASGLTALFADAPTASTVFEAG